ncbi:MAG TPA: UDP-N-acetylglucosamine 2-epimerase (non-hydrolyzing) [Sideroxyarcus sp.]|nr:UDP-N-acetylglucosamine 2-epimerase (non-hydrolyzing) [Sideroxyarcus sp.]
MRKILVVIGTRPEAIKMAPLVYRLRAEPALKTIVCLTAQHRQMLDQVLEIFDIQADEDLNLMKQGQSLTELHVNVMSGIDRVLERHKPDCMLVHGDTTTAKAAAMAAFYRHVAIGHVEAGLRTYDLNHPWPEEMNRRVIDLVSAHYFAPTGVSRDNLLKEGIAGDKIHVTGNTVIDALLLVVERIRGDAALRARLAAAFPFLRPDKRLILVTGHRRENHGGGLENICRALKRLAMRPDVQVVYPVHPNPNVRNVVQEVFADDPNMTLIEPQDYLHFVYLMQASYLILTDSGGIQEEAPSLGKPVLVMRDVTERPEAIAAGTIKLVGTDADRILGECARLLDDEAYYRTFSTHHNPYGDGRACQRIVEALLK